MGYSVKRRESEQAWAVLMRAAVNGDAGAYRQFLASLAPVLRATARRNCARVGLDGGEAEDVVQETLLAIHLKRHTWDLDRPIGPWDHGDRAPQADRQAAPSWALEGITDRRHGQYPGSRRDG